MLQAMKLNIGETIIMRNYTTLINGAKTVIGRQYLQYTLARLVELERNDFMLAEVTKISARKYQLAYITTQNNSFNMEDDDIFFTADWYNITMLNNVYMATYENALLGTCEEIRPVADAS